MKKKDNEQRVLGSIKIIVDLISNDNFINQRAPYIRMGEHMIAPKIQDIIYQHRDKLDIKEQLTGLITYLTEGLPDENFTNGVCFLLPYTTSIGLPSPYHATRFNGTNNNLWFSTVINVKANYGPSDDPALYGHSYILTGKLSSKEQDDEIADVLEECINNVNALLTAYRLVRHDHTIKNIDLQKLPSPLDSLSFSIKSEVELDEAVPLSLHRHDVMDVWSKRLLDNRAVLDQFRVFCELLRFTDRTRYLLTLMEESITSFCLGDLEDAILNSDRFAELSLRVCFTEIEELKNLDIADFHVLYSKNNPDKAVLNMIASSLNLKGNSLIGLWYEHSRKLRNDITHGLQFEKVTRDKAQQALKYNLKIVKLITDHILTTDETVKLLGMGANTYKELFETLPD